MTTEPIPGSRPLPNPSRTSPSNRMDRERRRRPRQPRCHHLAGDAGSGWPVTSGGVRERDHRFPGVGRLVLYRTGRLGRDQPDHSAEQPVVDASSDVMQRDAVAALSERVDPLAGCPPEHPDDNGPVSHGVGDGVADPGQGPRERWELCRYLLRPNAPHHSAGRA